MASFPGASILGYRVGACSMGFGFWRVGVCTSCFRVQFNMFLLSGVRAGTNKQNTQVYLQHRKAKKAWSKSVQTTPPCCGDTTLGISVK